MVSVIIHISSCNTWGTVKKGVRVDWGELEKVQQAVTHTKKNQTEKKQKNQTPKCSTFLSLKFIFSI